MTKKLGVSLLAIVLIVCMLSVGLFACKKDEPQTGDSVELQAVKAIVGGVQKSVENGDMKDLKVDATLGLKINNDKEYKVKLALDLNLLQYHDWNYTAATAFTAGTEYYEKDSKGNYVKAEGVTSYNFSEGTYYTKSKKLPSGAPNYTHSWIDAEVIDVKANKTLLGLYYSDSNQGNKDIYQGNTLYLQAATDAGQKKIAFPAPFIGGVQAALDGQVDFSGIDLTDEEIWDSLDEYLGIVASLAQDGVCTSTKAAITLNVGKLLDSDPDNEYSLITLVKGLQGYLDALGLDLKATELGDFLPNITLTLSADLEDGKVTGVDISLGLSKKDMTLKTIDKSVTPNAKNEFLVVKMDNAIDLTVSLGYAIGTATSFRPNDLNTYKKQENILDAKISADLYLGAPLGTSIELNKKELTIEAPAGYYTLEAQIAANPWEILAHIKEYSFDGVSGIISSITKMLQGVNALDLKLIRSKDKDGAAVPEAEQVVLHLMIGNKYEEIETGKYSLVTKDGAVSKFVTLQTSILGGDTELALEKASLSAALDLVDGFIEKSGKAPDSALSTDETTDLLKEIGGYLLGAYIGINDGVTGHGSIFASFDSTKTAKKIIPFSGYTKWTGKYNSNYDYYILDPDKKDGVDYGYVPTTDTEWNKNKTYYTWEEGKFVLVDQVAATFDAKRYYYVREGAGTEASPYTYTEYDGDKFDKDYAICVYEEGYWKAETITKASEFTPTTKDYREYIEKTDAAYKKVDITAFADNTEYYVKGGKAAGEFGIGLAATININNGIEINATVENMDIFGLPATINAKISNLSIELFNNDYPIFLNAGYGTFSDVDGKIIVPND